ncbi:MAG TPA: Trp biosynthesis-associated membrane protein [Mycobacteriales bacterium]|nr:Trp biosynthesis-associated membrane protein [Mycobacteriales bacterium]
MKGARPAVVIATCVVAALLVLAATARPWVTVSRRSPAPTADRPDAYLETTTDYQAGDVAAAVTPLALVVLAGALGVAGSRGTARRGVAAIVATAGATIARVAARVALQPARAVPDGPVSAAGVESHAAPWVAVVAGVVVTAAAVTAAVLARSWSAALGPESVDPASADAGEPPDDDAWD